MQLRQRARYVSFLEMGRSQRRPGAASAGQKSLSMAYSAATTGVFTGTTGCLELLTPAVPKAQTMTLAEGAAETKGKGLGQRSSLYAFRPTGGRVRVGQMKDEGGRARCPSRHIGDPNL
jgi:hypothetical protein